MLRHLLHLLRLVCAVVLMIWVVRQLRVEEIRAFEWSQIRLAWLLLALFLGGLSLLGWAGRWALFLRVYGLRPRFAELLRLTFYADFFNLYFLGPLGADGVRLLHLSRRFPDQRGAVVGSLLLDHVGGFLGGVIAYGLFSRTGALPIQVTRVLDQCLPWVAGVIVLGLGVIMEPPLQRLIAKLPGFRRFSRWAAPVYAGTFRHPWLFTGVAISVLSSACAFAAFWAAAMAVGAQVPWTVVMGIMPVVDLAASLPVSLSGLGVRENLLMDWLGQQPGVGSMRALAASLLGFAAIGVWGLIGGLWLLAGRAKSPLTIPAS